MYKSGGRDNQRKRVVIVDDSKTMQAMMEQIFSLRLQFDVVGLAGDVESAVAMIRSLKPDLVTIDLCMPYIDGKKLLEMLRCYPTLHKVVISSQATNLNIVAALEALGADGCIDKADLTRDAEGFRRKILAITSRPKRATPVGASDAAPPAPPVPTVAPAAIRYPIPRDEQARLIALARFGLANDDADHQLDLLTAHLGKTTNFPAALMTFIDRDKQWLKSAYGMPRGSTSRAIAFCNYTLCQGDTFVVENAAHDPRFRENAFVTGTPGIRTYVGHPIVTRAGIRLGALCLVDTKPRRTEPEVIVNLASVAAIAAELIEARPEVMRSAA